jgi:hypothetical protein
VIPPAECDFPEEHCATKRDPVEPRDGCSAEQCPPNSVHGRGPARPARRRGRSGCLTGDVAAVHQHRRRGIAAHVRRCGRVVPLPLPPDGWQPHRPQRAPEVLPSCRNVGASFEIDQFNRQVHVGLRG